MKTIEKLQLIAMELKEMAIEREQEVEMAILAILSGSHMLMLGAPGIAKSMLVRALCARVDCAKYFEYLLSKYTTDKDLFVSVTNIEEQVAPSGGKSIRFSPETTGMLPEAHIAFLDETFKGNSAVLNALLSLVNERKLHLEGKLINCPLLSLFGASNELPDEDEGLGALYDRFMIRMVSQRVKERGNRLAMRQKSRARRAKNSAGSTQPTMISLIELADLQKQVLQVKISPAIDERVEEIIEKLLTEGIIVSDRRDVRLDPILQAHALLDGRTQVTEADLSVLQHCLWSSPSEIKAVQKTVLTFSNPMENKAIELLDQAEEIRSNAVQAKDPAAGAEANTKLKNLTAEIEQLLNSAKSQGVPTAKIIEAKMKIQNFNKEVLRVCLGLDL